MDKLNVFDAAIIGLTLLAVILGFRCGLLRSLATILGYVCAAPLAVAAAPMLGQLGGAVHRPLPDWLIFTALFVVSGMALAALMRLGVDELTGRSISAADRLGGAMLGAVRILLLAVLLVLVFDRLIPTEREPEFLAGSTLRPLLSAAGQQGLQSLPPEVADYIDRLKKERGI
ncbi:MAG TPA: CvpA family protein [Pseudolabrys sp.]|nr:CvpA family protein [Pseudolabrys sp.]